MRMKLAHSAGLVAGPGQRSWSLRSNGTIRVGPSSCRRPGKSAYGTLLVWWPTGLAALLYSKYCAAFVQRSIVVSSCVVDMVLLLSQVRRGVAGSTGRSGDLAGRILKESCFAVARH